MAIARLPNGAFDLYGLSSDTKPTQGIVYGQRFLEIDTSKVFITDGSTWTEWYGSEQIRSMPGGRNPGSAGNNYLAATPECNITILAPGLTQTVSAVPALLYGIAGANGVVNGSIVTLLDGGSTIETFPASTIPIAGIDYRGSRFNTSLVISIVVAAGTSLKVYWRAQ